MASAACWAPARLPARVRQDAQGRGGGERGGWCACRRRYACCSCRCTACAAHPPRSTPARGPAPPGLPAMSQPAAALPSIRCIAARQSSALLGQWAARLRLGCPPGTPPPCRCACCAVRDNVAALSSALLVCMVVPWAFCLASFTGAGVHPLGLLHPALHVHGRPYLPVNIRLRQDFSSLTPGVRPPLPALQPCTGRMHETASGRWDVREKVRPGRGLSRAARRAAPQWSSPRSSAWMPAASAHTVCMLVACPECSFPPCTC